MQISKSFTVLAIFSLLLFSLNDYAAANSDQIKAQILKKQGKKVTIQMNDQSKVKGSIVSVGDTSFQLRTKNGETKDIQYADVQKVSSGLSKGAKIALIVGVGVAVLAIIAIHSVNNFHFGNGNFLNGL